MWMPAPMSWAWGRGDNFIYGRHELFVEVLFGNTQIARQIVRTDQQGVHALDRGDVVQNGHCRLAFDVDDDHAVVVAFHQIVGQLRLQRRFPAKERYNRSPFKGRYLTAPTKSRACSTDST